MKFSLAFVVHVFALGQVIAPSPSIPAVNYARNVGQNIAGFIEFPQMLDADKKPIQTEPFTKVDFTVTIPKDASGAPVASYYAASFKDFALDGGKGSVVLQPDGSLKGTWTGPEKGHVGKALQFGFKCDRLTSGAVAFGLSMTATNAAGGVVELAPQSNDLLTIKGVPPAVKLSFGTAQ